MVPATLFAQFRRPGGRARGWLGLVLALALPLRLLVPQGWMPGPGGALILCPEGGPVAVAAMHHRGEHHAPGHGLPDHPCAFAGLGLAAAPPAPIPEVLARQALPAAVELRHLAVAIGRGLAAPPPPATGPPAAA